ncbi:MAG: hypothetical protein IJ068_05015 [Bacilli bacterium]|nr:hypothetical protein [Bacilli bacterium]
MNGNSSKQVLLSVLGIAILVVAVVGVSFAFFSYTKQGVKSNVIETGTIYTYMTETDTVALTNAMPLKETPDAQTSNQATDDVAVLAFAVTGANESATTITYKVYVEEGAAPSGKTAATQRLYNEDIQVRLKETGHSDGTVEIPAALNSDAGTTVLALTNGSGTKVTTAVPATLIATGTFPKDSSETHQYYLNMWVNNNATISDTDLKVNNVDTKYCASAAGTPATPANPGCLLEGAGTTYHYFTGAYYSLKVRVVANTTAANTGANYNGFAGSY